MNNFVYSKEYNIKCLGLEKIHPFDTCKFEKIAKHLEENCGIDSFVSVNEVSDNELLEIHTQDYLDRLNNSSEVADLCELFFMRFMPISVIKRYMLSPMRHQVKGTIKAGELAIRNGWSVNIGGGMHHASSDDAGGWCLFSDIPLSIKNLISKKMIKKAMIIDLDVHQGNGIESDISMFKNNSIYMIDCYNHDIYPQDEEAKDNIDIDIKVTPSTTDKTYLKRVKNSLTKGLKNFKPDIVFYNAGTDILDGDPLNGGVSISHKGVIKRDELVMKTFIDKKIPIVMVLSGGYSSESVSVIQNSLSNLCKKLM